MFESDLLIKYEKLISQTSLQLLKMQFIRANIILSFQEQMCDITFNVVFNATFDLKS